MGNNLAAAADTAKSVNHKNVNFSAGSKLSNAHTYKNSKSGIYSSG